MTSSDHGDKAGMYRLFQIPFIFSLFTGYDLGESATFLGDVIQKYVSWHGKAQNCLMISVHASSILSATLK